MGFGDPRKVIEIKGVKVCPFDVVMSLVARPENDFLGANRGNIETGEKIISLLGVEVDGFQSGRAVNHLANFINVIDDEKRRYLFNTFGAINVLVALPAIVGAKMITAGNANKGVIAPECLDPGVFFGLMSDMGYPIELEETIVKK